MTNPLPYNTTEEQAVPELNAILTGYEFLCCLDEVKNTPYYNGKLNTMINNLLPALEKIANETQKICGVEEDDKTLFTLREQRKILMKEIATFRPEYKNGFGELLAMFKEKPEWLLFHCGIKIY